MKSNQTLRLVALSSFLLTGIALAAPGTVSGKVSATNPTRKEFTLTEGSGRDTNYLVTSSTYMSVNGSKILGVVGLKKGDRCDVTADTGTTLKVECTR